MTTSTVHRHSGNTPEKEVALPPREAFAMRLDDIQLHTSKLYIDRHVRVVLCTRHVSSQLLSPIVGFHHEAPLAFHLGLRI